MKTIYFCCIVICFLFLVGCTNNDGMPFAVGKRCINGVVYYSSGYQLPPAYNPDGKLCLCNKNGAY